MKTVICLIVVVCAVVYARPGDSVETYPSKYDNINTEAIYKNDRLLRTYIDCLLGKKKCTTKEAELLKEFLPDAIKTKCEKCTEKQKEEAKKIARYLIDNKAAWWKELEDAFDPDGGFRKKYAADIKAAGFSP